MLYSRKEAQEHEEVKKQMLYMKGWVEGVIVWFLPITTASPGLEKIAYWRGMYTQTLKHIYLRFFTL